jgi:Ca2+-binding RTX toxin-like protein
MDGGDDVRADVGTASGTNVLFAGSDVDGTNLTGAARNDWLFGGSYDDALTGRAGDDHLFGRGGADEFRFFGDEIGGPSDLDRIYDLSFEEGDTLNFGNFGPNTFSRFGGVGASADGTAAVLDSWSDVVSAASFSDRVTALRDGPYGYNLVLQVISSNGEINNIIIDGGWLPFVDAGGMNGL